MYKVEGHSNLIKSNSGAVITTDKKAYERAKARKLEKNRLEELENRMKTIETLLTQLVNK
jgi:hypothetical protein